jgi:hypothetical protein
MRRTLAAATLLAAAALGARAEAQPPACPPSAHPPSIEEAQLAIANPRDRGFLWTARKDGRTSYLYGTVHVAKLEWAFPGRTVVNAVRASEVVALELDVLDDSVVRRLLAGMRPRPEQAIDAALTQRLALQLRAACLPQELMAAMSPEMLATTLSVLAGRRDGLDPAYAVDRSLSSLGRRLGKPVLSLETPEQQLEALQSDDPREARQRIDQALSGLESGRSVPMLRRIAGVWADSRLDELERYADWCGCMQTDDERALMKRLLDERNPGLAQRIDEIHQAGKTVFAAVGSLHMIGPQGLPALLAQRGFRVEPVPFR